MEAELHRGLAFVAAAALEHQSDEPPLDLAHHQGMETRDRLLAEPIQQRLECARG